MCTTGTRVAPNWILLDVCGSLALAAFGPRAPVADDAGNAGGAASCLLDMLAGDAGCRRFCMMTAFLHEFGIACRMHFGVQLRVAFERVQKSI